MTNKNPTMYATIVRAWNGDSSMFYWFDNKEDAIKKFDIELDKAVKDFLDDCGFMEYVDKARKDLYYDACEYEDYGGGDYTVIRVLDLTDGHSFEVVN